MEGFETSPLNFDVLGARTLVFPAFQAEYGALSGDPALLTGFGVANFSSSGAGPTQGSQYLHANYASATNPGGVLAYVTFHFPIPLLAFAVDIKDLENGSLIYTTSLATTGPAAAAGPDGWVQFFGIIFDAPVNFIRFSGPGGGDSVVFDQVQFVSIPEPGALWLACAGMAAVLMARRTRPRQSPDQ